MVTLFIGREGRAVTLPGVTDDKGNGHIVGKLFSPKHPMCTADMQLAADLNEKGAELDLALKPREENEVADKLSNGIVEGFDPKLRKRLYVKDLKMLNKILDLKMLTEDRSLHEEGKAEKARSKLPPKEEAFQESCRPARKPGEKLHNKDIWI